MLKFNITNIGFLLIGLILISLLQQGYSDMWIPLIACFIGYLLIIALGTIHVNYQFYMPIICRLPNPDNCIFLSFDDGPHKNTREILILLKKYGATGNFFCTGRHLEEHPLIAQQLVDEGHFIGNHSYSHTPSFPVKSEKKIVNELKNTNSIIERYTNEPCLFFRPPFGVSNPTIAKAVKILNMKTIGWSIRSFDTQDREGRKAINKIKRNLKSGDIVLLHDHSLQILSILEELLGYIKVHNFTTQRIDTVLKLSKK